MQKGRIIDEIIANCPRALPCMPSLARTCTNDQDAGTFFFANSLNMLELWTPQFALSRPENLNELANFGR